jgi:ribosomal protein L7/L12
MPLIREGRMVDAIKLCREKTGLGLAEAKDYCDAMRLLEKVGKIGSAKNRENRLMVVNAS